jgi:hypothetical protein
MDYYSFQNVYRVLAGIMALLGATLSSIVTMKYLYLIWIFGIWFCEAGHFSILPVVCQQIFGEHQGYFLYALISYSFNVGNLISGLAIKYLCPLIGHDMTFLLFLVTIFGPMFVVSYLNIHVNWKESIDRMGSLKNSGKPPRMPHNVEKEEHPS